ncbi:MAG: protein kinase, partial [Acidobacteriota bacterium]|nr:protein kinase [Acidobacteriota bacterium]
MTSRSLAVTIDSEAAGGQCAPPLCTFAMPAPNASLIEEAFHAASELHGPERDSCLDRICGSDTEIRRVVEALLRADQCPGTFPVPFAPPAATPDPADSSLDRYRILDRIGMGGMGVVYKAVRSDDEFSKLVALKIVRAAAGDAGGQSLISRFRNERQILASLEHPHIARLLDGGTTPEGMPFLVMEYVDGIPLDRYLHEHTLTLRERIELFRQLCSAVSYAHQKLIVHRDLKPANILVAADGAPRLLDFGIARLLDDSAGRTVTGVAAMTPEYASPEQIRSLPLSTSTDIYSLGVLLYEILSGHRPYRKTSGPLELAQAICNDAPPHIEKIDSDLETIVRTALNKEPERRYASVEQFSNDLRLYLDGFPIAARPATRVYRIRKFLARNLVPVAAGALVSITLVAGIAATAWEAHVANQRFNDVRALATSYLFEFHDAIKDLPGSTPARQLVVKRALQYLDRLSEQRGSDRALGRELASAYQRVGDVQGGPLMPSLGDREGFLASYRKAIAIQEPLMKSSPDDPLVGVDLGASYMAVGRLEQFSGKLRDASAWVKKAADLLTALPQTDEVRVKLGDCYMLLGDIVGNNEMPNLGDAKGAAAWFSRAVKLKQQLLAARPGDRDRRLELAYATQKLGIIDQALDEKEASAAAWNSAVNMYDQLLASDPRNTTYRRGAAISNRSLALILFRLKRLPESRAHGDKAAAFFEQLSKEDPSNLQAREELADSIFSQGYFNQDAAPQNAFRSFEQAISLYETLVRKGYRPAGERTAWQLMAGLSITTKDPDRAIRAANQELKIDDEQIAEDARNAGAWRNRGVAYTDIGRAYELKKDLPEALDWYRKSLAIWVRLKNEGTLIPMYAFKLPEAERRV